MLTDARSRSAAGAPEAPERSLDPDDWAEFATLAHAVVDDVVDLLRASRDRGAWRPMAEAVRATFLEGLPREGRGLAETLREVKGAIAPFSLGNRHPRFWGWAVGAGTASSALADFIAGALNVNSFAGDHAGTHVEAQVLRWTAQFLGLPARSGGVLVAGASMSNLLALVVARNAAAPAAAVEGLRGGAPLAVYASSETHASVAKAVAALGIGTRWLRLIPVGPRQTMQIDALAERIRADRRDGVTPMCVIGNAGTVNTGAVDDLAAIAHLCAAHADKIWFHVDAAIGGPACLSPRLRALFDGIELADSVSVDFHKWLSVAFDAGALVVRDAEVHRTAFSGAAAYLAATSGGLMGTPLAYKDFGIDLSRGFRALKVWMAFKEYGADGLARVIEQGFDQAQYLADRVRSHADLQLLAPVPLNIVCFRFAPDGVDEATLEALNRALLVDLQLDGTAVLSSTTLDGKFSLRAANVNHRTRRDDFDVLVEAVVTRGRALVSDGKHVKGPPR